jgi:LysM repeat protein
MAKPDLGIPERPAPRPRAGCRWGAVLALVALLVLLACGIAMFYFARIPTYTLPNVLIVDPPYGAELVSGRTVPVLSSARSADRITKQELWADGLLVYVASTTDPQGQRDFTATMLWTPKSGPHTLIARALDARGNMGTSSVVRVTVTEPASKEQPQNALQIAKAGDSLSSIGAENNVTPEAMQEANPDLSEQLAPGDWVNVPPGADEEGSNDDQLGGAVNDPGAAPLPGDLPVGPANPNPNFPGFGPPLLFWDTILPWRDTGLWPPAAPKLKVAPGPDCSAVLTWQDNSNSEKGFYLYRLIPGAPRFARMEPGFPANNANIALSYTDRGVFGHIEYYVVAFNAAGEAASRPVSVDIVEQNCMRNPIPQVLEVEAASLTVNGQPEEVYCYAALKGLRPFERIPEDQSRYLRQRRAGGWNIDEYYAGANKQVVPAPEAGQSFRVEVECWGARVTNEGGESFSLGRFDQSHLPAEWDGRALTGRGSSFTLVYHIRPWTMPEGGWQNVDTDWTMLPPSDFRQVVGIDQCITHTAGDAGSRFACALMEYPSQTANIWEWDGNPADIDGFRILENRSATGGEWVPIMDVGKDERMWFAPLPYQRTCGETRRYKVKTFVRDQDRTSPSSNEITRGGGECHLVLNFITLEVINTGKLDDGCTWVSLFNCRDDKTMEAYGAATFWTVDETTGEHTNQQILSVGGGHLEDRVTVRGTNSGSPMNLHPFKIHSNDRIEWKDIPLCHVGKNDITYYCEDRTEPNNNQMVLLSKLGGHLQGKVSLMDYDNVSGDDLWCDLDFDFHAPDVLNFDPQVDYGDWVEGDKGYGSCEVLIKVRWAHALGSRQVRAGENPLSPVRPEQADLEVTNVSRNSIGNVRVTLSNHGPDTLTNDPITLRLELIRTPTAEVPYPDASGSTERFVVTVPAYGQTTLDTGSVLDEEFEKRVTVTVSTFGNLADPDETNNTRCFWFMPGDWRFPLPYRHACR